MKNVENQLRNLEKRVKFKKGNSGNPLGRPKGKSISTYLKQILDKKIPPQILKSKSFKELGISENITTSQLIALMNVLGVFYKFNPTQLKSIEMILDRTEGKPHQSHEISGKEGNPLIVQFKEAQ